jgi:hypothetical protein
MKKIAFFILIFGLIGSIMAVAPVATQTRQVKGVGSTRQLAVKNALYEAVSQVQGVRVGTGIATSSAGVGSIDITREEVNKSIEMEGISVSAIDSITMTMADGLVKSYSVIDETKTDDGKVRVTVDVEVYDYQSPLASTKMGLAVTPFEVQQDLYRFGSIRIPGQEIATQFSQRLTTLFNDSGKFDMLDRAYTQEFFEERAALRAGGTTVEQQARTGQVLGADYLLSGRIRRAVIEPESVVLPSTGIRVEEYRGFFVAETRLLVPTTRQVAFSREYRIKIETEEVKALADDWKSDERDFYQIKDAFLDLAARQIVEAVMNDLFPVRVASVSGSEIILDQGGERMKPDAVYHVYSMGDTIRDPQTQEVLGQDETQVATVEPTRILPRFSYARVLDGSQSQIQVGQVCRIDPASLDLDIEIEGGMRSNIRRTPTGGVRLPFD